MRKQGKSRIYKKEEENGFKQLSAEPEKHVLFLLRLLWILSDILLAISFRIFPRSRGSGKPLSSHLPGRIHGEAPARSM